MKMKIDRAFCGGEGGRGISETYIGKSTAAFLQLFESHLNELKLSILVQSFLLKFLFANACYAR